LVLVQVEQPKKGESNDNRNSIIISETDVMKEEMSIIITKKS